MKGGREREQVMWKKSSSKIGSKRSENQEGNHPRGESEAVHNYVYRYLVSAPLPSSRIDRLDDVSDRDVSFKSSGFKSLPKRRFYPSV